MGDVPDLLPLRGRRPRPAGERARQRARALRGRCADLPSGDRARDARPDLRPASVDLRAVRPLALRGLAPLPSRRSPGAEPGVQRRREAGRAPREYRRARGLRRQRAGHHRAVLVPHLDEDGKSVARGRPGPRSGAGARHRARPPLRDRVGDQRGGRRRGGEPGLLLHVREPARGRRLPAARIRRRRPWRVRQRLRRVRGRPGDRRRQRDGRHAHHAQGEARAGLPGVPGCAIRAAQRSVWRRRQ